MAGDFEQARLYYGQALEVNQRGGTRATEASILGNLGYVDLNLGDYDAARARFAQSRETFARVGQRRGTGIALINLALVSLHSGQPQTAIEQAGEALAFLVPVVSAGSKPWHCACWGRRRWLSATRPGQQRIWSQPATRSSSSNAQTWPSKRMPRWRKWRWPPGTLRAHMPLPAMC
jgi:tetratricopeptide (TPR) repeat protein